VRRSYKSAGQKLTQRKSLSILIATFWDYPHTGGLSSYIKTLSEGLRQQGHHVDIISPKQFPADEAEAMRKDVVPKIKSLFTTRYGSSNSMIVHNQKYAKAY
jgi:hypothetical protein